MTKVESIQAAALQLFTERGFDATPTAQIAKTAGVATGTLFHHFKSKDDLIDKLYLVVKASMMERIRRGINEEASVRERLRQVWYNSVGWGLDFPEQYSFFRQYVGSRYISQASREAGQTYRGFLLELLKEGVDEGALKSADVELLYTGGSGQVMEVIALFASNEKMRTNKLQWESAWKMFWDALAQHN